MQVRRSSAVAIGLVVLVGFFDNSSQFPIIAPYAQSLGAGPALIGLVVAIYSVTNLAGNLIAGYLLDRFGRQRLLVAGLCLVGMTVLLYAAVGTPQQLILIRALHGLTAAVLAPAAFTLLGDLFPREQRSRAMGANGMLIAVAAMVAPPVSGLLRDRLGFGAVFLFVGLLMLLTALVAWAFIREPQRRGVETNDLRPAPLALLARPGLQVAFLAAVGLSFGLGVLVTHMPLHLSDLGYGGTHTGFAFSAYAAATILAMAAPMLLRREVKRRLTASGTGLVIAGLALVVLGASSELSAVIGAMMLYGIGFGLIFPPLNAFVADSTEQWERGMAFGLFYAFYSVGVILGSSASGLAISMDRAPSPFHLGAVVASALGVAVLLARSAGQLGTAARDDGLAGA